VLSAKTASTLSAALRDLFRLIAAVAVYAESGEYPQENSCF
jgi:hypothetical protein